MRFGKRSRTRPIAAHRETNDLGEAMLGPVATEERSALLSYESTRDETTVPLEGDVLTGADPTQRLVTALGRFHRYVVKGQTGAPQAYWSDDCMNQMATAIEIALSQNWMHIVEALTDVARILQSYENAGCANLCVPFLNESYEMLSLMVGDLLVNNVGGRIMDRWRERYQRAVDDLASAGLTLVQDEDDSDVKAAIILEEIPPVEESKIVPFGRPKVNEPASTEHARQGVATPCPMEEPGEDAPAQAVNDSFLPFLDATEKQETASDEAPEKDPEEAPPSAGVPRRTVADAEVARILDTMCEDLAQLEKLSGAQHAAQFNVIAENVGVLELYSEQLGLEAPKEICRRMAALCQIAAAQGIGSDDRFLDSAYAFCEAYVEASKDPESEVAANWLAESASLVASQDARESPETAPEPAEADWPGDLTPEALLGTAQQAVARGDMAGAKAIALRAVASMAKSEAEKAEARVRETELRFRESGEAIDRARGNVKKAEQEVLVAESRAAEGETELRDTRGAVDAATENANGIEKRISEIDEQMRALQAARETEAERAREASQELIHARAEEEDAEAELRSLQEAEDAARLRLEDARQHGKDMQRRRAEVEATLSRSRETLTRHRTSLADIERTVAQLQTSQEAAPAKNEDLLF